MRKSLPLGRSLKILVSHLFEGEVHILASSLAFATVISIVPFLAITLSIFHSFGDYDALTKTVENFLINNVVPGSGSSDIALAIRKSIARVHSGALGASGLIGLLLVSTKIFFDIEVAVQKIWQFKERPSLSFRLIMYWLVLFSVPIAFAIVLGIASYMDFGILERMPKGTLSFLFTFGLFFAINKWMPTILVNFRLALVSAFTGACIMGLAHAGYSTMTRKILNYNTLYGSLASVPIFLLWILVIWWICLGSVALCATFHHISGRDPKSCPVTA